MQPCSDRVWEGSIRTDDFTAQARKQGLIALREDWVKELHGAREVQEMPLR